jgi:hypothetical protein
MARHRLEEKLIGECAAAVRSAPGHHAEWWLSLLVADEGVLRGFDLIAASDHFEYIINA